MKGIEVKKMQYIFDFGKEHRYCCFWVKFNVGTILLFIMLQSSDIKNLIITASLLSLVVTFILAIIL